MTRFLRCSSLCLCSSAPQNDLYRKAGECWTFGGLCLRSVETEGPGMGSGFLRTPVQGSLMHPKMQ